MLGTYQMKSWLSYEADVDFAFAWAWPRRNVSLYEHQHEAPLKRNVFYIMMSFVDEIIAILKCRYYFHAKKICL